MIGIAKVLVIGFGVFLIGVGVLMLVNPKKTRDLITKAGSTNFINYFEITVRMIPAAALVVFAPHSKFPEVFSILGWFMIATSLVLYIVPRKYHHNYALKSAEILKPNFIRMLSPLSLAFGAWMIYGVI